MDITDFLQERRADLAVYIKGSVSVTQYGFGDGNPWVVVAEDSGILFISRRIRGDFTEIQMISAVRRLKDGDTVFGVQPFLNGFQRLLGKPFFDTYAGQRKESLRFDVDLSFFAFCGADFLGICIVSTEEPFSVPAVFQDRIVYFSTSASA